MSATVNQQKKGAKLIAPFFMFYKILLSNNSDLNLLRI